MGYLNLGADNWGILRLQRDITSRWITSRNVVYLAKLLDVLSVLKWEDYEAGEQTFPFLIVPRENFSPSLKDV